MKVTFDFKLSIIHQIANAQTSVNQAANKYNISRSSIDYWIKKLSNFDNKLNSMSKNNQIKTHEKRV
jgi:transposase-like protein